LKSNASPLHFAETGALSREPRERGGKAVNDGVNPRDIRIMLDENSSPEGSGMGKGSRSRLEKM